MKKSNVNKGIIWIVIIVLFGIISNRIYSQSPVDSVGVLLKVAKRYQNGVNCEVNLQKSFKIYNYLTAKGSPIAMNELAKMYRDGEGVKQNYEYAYGFFKKASELGNNSATCNLALMYHKGEGIEQNFSKAYELYDIAAKNGNPQGCYGAGYLIYKGFGVKQNYLKAIEYFNKGAEKGHSCCDYMLACYWLTGHDNNQDIEKGKAHLEQAMKHGHGWVLDITKKNVIDSLQRCLLKDPKNWTDVKKGKINNNKRQFMNKATETDLQGVWAGKVYTYDWSGGKIEKEEEVKLKISSENQTLSIQWFEKDNLITTYNAENNGNVWVASNKKQYDKSSPTRWFLYRSRYDIEKTKNGETLYADFQKFNMDTREPTKPSVAVLERIKENKPDSSHISITKIYPNPFSNELYVEFEIDTNQKITVEIYNIVGNKVYSSTKSNFLKGKNSTTIWINLIQGNYTIYLKGDNISCCKTIIRK